MFEAGDRVPDLDRDAVSRVGLDADLGWLDEIPPGADLARALEGLDVSSLGELSAVDALAAWSRLESWVAAGKAVAVARVGRVEEEILPTGHVLSDPGREQVATALRISPLAAANEVGWSRMLVGVGSPTLEELRRGRLTARSARVVMEEIVDLADDQARGVQEVILPRARAMTPQAVRRATRRVACRVAAEDAHQRHIRATAGRYVRLLPSNDGMAVIDALLPATDATVLFRSLDAAARLAKDHDRGEAAAAGLEPGDLPGIDAYRADALAMAGRLLGRRLESASAGSDRFGGNSREAASAGNGGSAGEPISAASAGTDTSSGGSAESCSRRHGGHSGFGGQHLSIADDGLGAPPWQAHVVVDLPTALGLADNPGEILGCGPIPGPVARRLAADAGWRRWITERMSDGNLTQRLVDVGQRTYRPSSRLRSFILARDRTCRFPGCEQPSSRCDIDHAEPWDRGGATSASNVGALCRRHHLMKTHLGWQIAESGADGSCEWITPLGGRVRRTPEPLAPLEAAGPEPERQPPHGPVPGRLASRGHAPHGPAGNDEFGPAPLGTLGNDEFGPAPAEGGPAPPLRSP